MFELLCYRAMRSFWKPVMTVQLQCKTITSLMFNMHNCYIKQNTEVLQLKDTEHNLSHSISEKPSLKLNPFHCNLLFSSTASFVEIGWGYICRIQTNHPQLLFTCCVTNTTEAHASLYKIVDVRRGLADQKMQLLSKLHSNNKAALFLKKGTPIPCSPIMCGVVIQPCVFSGHVA